MGNSRARLSRAEWRLMHLCWRLGPATAREVHAAANREQIREYRTIKTFLDRMAAKGYLRVESVDGVNRYEPVVDRERTLREAVEEFLVDVMDGTVGPVLAQLADTRRLSADDVERLRELVPEQPEADGEEETP